jgi:3-methyladenine DNA glycosylase/8-oxoguanine DNA glycosylase
MTITARIRATGPYSLALTARGASDATRVWRNGVLRAVVGGRQASATQLRDATILLRGPNEESIERLRWLLAVDADHTEFLRRFRKDKLLRGPISHLQGKRVLRVDTVAQALLRALCGQLIEAWRARAMEKRIIRKLSQPVGDLYAPPDCETLGRASPAELRALGLHARRGATLARLCRSVELERLKELPSATVSERLERERGLGAWSVGVVCLEGLGRSDYGLVGDLGLVQLMIELEGRWVEGHETAALLEPYGEWAGLASVYLMAGFGRGLIPLPAGERIRRPPHRIQSRAA